MHFSHLPNVKTICCLSIRRILNEADTFRTSVSSFCLRRYLLSCHMMLCSLFLMSLGSLAWDIWLGCSFLRCTLKLSLNIAFCSSFIVHHSCKIYSKKGLYARISIQLAKRKKTDIHKSLYVFFNSSGFSLCKELKCTYVWTWRQDIFHGAFTFRW